MKKSWILIALLLTSFNIMAGGGKSEKITYLPGNYTIDNAHTRVSFKIDHFVISHVEGRFNQVQGKIHFDNDFNKSSVAVTIPISSIDTAIAKRDEHLKSADFFDAKKYPTMKFQSKKFKGSPSEFSVIGDLTIKDVTKQVKFKGEYKGSVKDSWGNTRSVVELRGKINRKDFHINYDDKIDIGPAVGDLVKIKIITEAILDLETKK